MIIRRFLTIIRRFPKIFKMLSAGGTNVSEHFPTFLENFRIFPKIAEEDPKMSGLNVHKICSFGMEKWQPRQQT